MEYKNNCQTAILLGILIFQRVFLYYTSCNHYPTTVLNTPKVVVYQGAVLKKRIL